jgi:glutathione peroxidase
LQPGKLVNFISISVADSVTQFGGQEPGDDGTIAEFCQRNHGVSFPLMKKSDVNGDTANETFKYLKAQKAGLLGLTRIKVCLILFDLIFLTVIAVQWNFEKFLIDKEGKVVNRWASTTNPQAIDAEIAKLV